MEKVKLTKEEKIKILQKATIEYKQYAAATHLGLCFSLKWVVPSHMKQSGYKFLRTMFKEFTITNARRLSKKYKFKRPNGKCNGYWWSLDESEARISFLNALIKEIENEVN
jgi:hypothetical protein